MLPPLPPFVAQQLPPGLRRSMMEVGGHAIHVMEWGAGRPVLMLHGNPSWGFLYRKVVAALSDAPLRLIVPDLLGLGCSEKPRDPGVHTLAHHGALLAELIERLALPELVFVGQDWGGPIGLRALAHAPERLAGLVLLNTVVGPPKPGFKPTAFHRFARARGLSDLVFRGLGAPPRGMKAAQGDRRSIQGDVARAYRWPLSRVGDRVAPLALARMVPDSPEHPSVPDLQISHDLVTSFSGPTEIVWGDRDPVLGGVVRHLERLLPEARVTHTRGGHFIQEEHPEEIAAAVRRVCGCAG